MSAKSKLIKMATGSTSAATTKAGNKPLSMSAYRSMTSKERATTKLNARRANNMGEITDKEYDTIVDRIDAANAAESQRMTTKMQQGVADKNAPPVTLKKPLPPERRSNNPPAKKNPRDMTKEELKAELKKQEEKAKPRMKKGGMPKKKKPTSNYAYGGMTTSKPRTGNTDYRKGGMFMKNGKK